MSGNLNIVRKFLELVGEAEENRIISEHDICFSEVNKLLSPDFTIRNPLFHPTQGIIPSIGDAIDGSLTGTGALEADIKATASHFTFSVKNSELHDAGDIVLFRGTITICGTRSNKTIETFFAELFFIQDGLIERIEPFMNVNALRLII